MSDQYSKLSYTITKSLSKEQKKRDGIFFTPLNTIQSNLKSLKPYFNKIKNVLEPSCGTCEYINEISKEYKKINPDVNIILQTICKRTITCNKCKNCRNV